MLRSCKREISPRHLAAYLLELAGLFHPFYEARLALCGGVRAVMAECLGLLGVSAIREM